MEIRWTPDLFTRIGVKYKHLPSIQNHRDGNVTKTYFLIHFFFFNKVVITGKKHREGEDLTIDQTFFERAHNQRNMGCNGQGEYAMVQKPKV